MIEQSELRKFLGNCFKAAKLEYDDAIKRDLLRYSNEMRGRMMAYEHIIQKIDS